MPAAHGATVNGRLVGRTARLAEFLSLSFHSFTRTRAVKRGIGHMPLIRAEVAKRQTQRTQNLIQENGTESHRAPLSNIAEQFQGFSQLCILTLIFGTRRYL
jgi:hypothetical protein